MKEFYKVAKFKYNNSYYVMYLDKENKHFFLKVDDNKLHYVSDVELLKLTNIFTSIALYMNIERSDKIKIVPKVIKGGMSLVLSASMLLGCAKAYNEQNEDDLISENTVLEYVSTENSLNNEDDFSVDTYKEGNILNYLYIYDMDYLDKVFEAHKVTKDELFTIVNLNNDISQTYKELLYEYIEAVMNKYPDVELRVFRENLKTLKIYEYSEEDLLAKLGNSSYTGTYSKTENAIYVLKDKKYEKGSWDYQVIFHELSHCLRTGMYKDDTDRDIQIDFESRNYRNSVTTEALNSLFAVSLFENDGEVAYQLQSNYFKVMLECTDNYNLADYVNHSQSYFVQKLDENNEGKATVILDLMEMQYNDYYSPEIEVDQSEYYPIYDYLCDMYFKKYISSDFTYEEAYNIAGELLDKVTYNVPIDYNIDYSRFYDNLEKYCENIHINGQNKVR